MKAIQILCIAFLVIFAYSFTCTGADKAACQKGTSGDDHCCWTTALGVSACGWYNKAAYELIPKTIEEAKKADKTFNIECASSFLKIGIVALISLLF